MKPAIVIITGLLILDVGLCGKLHKKLQVNRKCECGVSHTPIATRIVGGTIAIPHSHPWVVTIFQNGMLHCGGALINDRYILTAGHCVRRPEERKEMTIGLGIHNRLDPDDGYVAAIDSVILHEKFKSDESHDINDLALIKLTHPVKYTKNIQPVCLPTKGSDYAGRTAKVAGWGRVKSKGVKASEVLREATLRVMSYKECQKTSYEESLLESMMCAYKEGSDACQGDSGGPLLIERSDGTHETIGVVSWGFDCAKPGYPGVYVKLTDYLDWIYDNTKDATYCEND